MLVESCYACHSAKSKPLMGGLRLDSRAFMLKGGDRGPSIVPGHPEKSILLRAIEYRDRDRSLQMPPKGKLPAEQIAVLFEWVKRGAPWPADPVAAATAPKAFDLQARRDRHWSFQPVRRPPLPAVRRKSWPQSPIDFFTLAKLEAAGLAPAPPADRRTLIRRVTFDLTGLPPAPGEIDAFLADTSPDAYRKVVDRLLASPHYGERWARHWLDLVRFAETDGHEFDFEKLHAFQYRDYLIRAFNADVPYDRFVMEHLAGDLLPDPRKNPESGVNESIIGTGFFWLGEGKHSPVDLLEDECERVDNQIDVMSKTFLGLSVGCARCHDHKFDPISTRDFYALSGYLKSSRFQYADVNPPDRVRPVVEQLGEVNWRLHPAVLGAVNLPASESETPAGSVVFEEFAGPGYGDWFATGFGFGAGPTSAPIPRLDLRQEPARIEAVYPAGVADSGAISDRLHGVLRSRTFTLSKGKILFRMAGRDSQVNLIIDGFQRIRNPIYGGLTLQVKNGGPLTWQAMEVAKWIGHRAYLELIDQGDGYLAVDRILFSDQEPPPGPRAAPPVAISGGPELTALLADRKRLDGQVPSPQWVMAIADGTPENDRVHLRGSHKTLGEEVPRRFLEACGGVGDPAPATRVGRLELAERIVSPANPLLARVMVNRIWKHHFGEGIVRSPDDFGAMGQPPTHPELLDFLANGFVSGDCGRDSTPNTQHPTPNAQRPTPTPWSLKSLHRLLVLSATYQMSSRAEPAVENKDPQNRLLHRMPVRRLEAEAIRDALLAVSGRLDRKMFGPGVSPHLTPFMEGRGRPGASGPLDGEGRRSIYLNIRRNFLPPLFLAFDYPIPFTTMGKRSVSTVPAQALILMNNPFVIEQAGYWGRRVLSEPAEDAAERVRKMYVAAFSRPADPEELSAGLAFLAEQDRSYGTENDPRSWGDLGHVLFNLKEYLFIR